jgi:hypothetical protein
MPYRTSLGLRTTFCIPLLIPYARDTLAGAALGVGKNLNLGPP